MGSVRRRKEIQLFHLGGMTAVISTELKWSLSDETELFSVTTTELKRPLLINGMANLRWERTFLKFSQFETQYYIMAGLQ